MSMLKKAKNRLFQLLIPSNSIGKNVRIGAGAYVKGSDLQGNVSIDNHAKLYHVSISGEVSIGKYTSLWGPNIHIDCVLNPVRIGNFCSIAKNVTFQEYNHDINSFTTYFIRQNLFKDGTFRNEIVSKGSIIVEHDVWIGAHCVILGGAHIATGAVIAANSVVNGYIPPYAVAGGSPAKVIKYRFEEKVIEKLLVTEWWNWDEHTLKEKYNDLMSIIRN